MKLLWTTRELADAGGVSRSAIHRIVRRFPDRFRPPTLHRRGQHPRLHRIFDEQEAQFILQMLAGHSKCS